MSSLHSLLCHGFNSSPLGLDLPSSAITLHYLIPGQVKPDGPFFSRRGLNFGDFVRKTTLSSVCVFFFSLLNQLSRILTFRNNGEAAVHNTDLQPSSVMGLFKFICAIITRALFLLVSLIGVWRVKRVKEDDNYWLLTFLFLPLLAEMIITLKRRKGQDYKW